MQGGDDGGLGGNLFAAGVHFFVFVLKHLLEELGDGAFAFCCLSNFGAWGEDAEGWVEGDLVYAYGRDITSEKKAQSELARTKELAQSEARYQIGRAHV